MPACEENERPMDLKMAASATAGEAKGPEDFVQKEHADRFEVKKSQQFRVTATEQRTLVDGGVKNLSIIVETSREYKSSSSGSGASACSKLLPFTPGESRSEAHLKRFSSSQTDDSRKTPFAYKTQSTYGYEASAELSCTGPKPTNDHEAHYPPPKENEGHAIAPKTSWKCASAAYKATYDDIVPHKTVNDEESLKNMEARRGRVADVASRFENNLAKNVAGNEDKFYRPLGKVPSLNEETGAPSHCTVREFFFVTFLSVTDSYISGERCYNVDYYLEILDLFLICFLNYFYRWMLKT